MPNALSSAPGDTVGLSSWIATLALFGLLVFVIFAPLLTVDAGGAAGEGNAARQVVYVLIFLVALASAQVTRYPQRLWALPTSILLVLAWCCLSITWAVDPGVGARRLLLTVVVVFSVFLLSRAAGYERSVAAVRVLLPVILLANYVGVLGWPSWAIHQSATSEDPSIIGAWRGILVQKNFAGAVCAYTVIFFLLDARKIHRVLRIAVVLAAGYFLYRTQSKTSVGFLFASVAIAATFTLYNPRYRVTAAMFLGMGASLVALLAYLNWATLAAPFAREDFLTGRVQIWPVLLRYSQDHLLLGSGYGSFWNVRNPQPIVQYTKTWVAQIASGHNGYIDLLVQIGLPGLALAVVATVLAPMRTFLRSLSLERSRGSLLLACVLFSLCHNLTESSLFDRDATVQVFLMLAIALLAVETESERRHASE